MTMKEIQLLVENLYQFKKKKKRFFKVNSMKLPEYESSQALLEEKKGTFPNAF